MAPIGGQNPIEQRIIAAGTKGLDRLAQPEADQVADLLIGEHGLREVLQGVPRAGDDGAHRVENGAVPVENEELIGASHDEIDGRSREPCLWSLTCISHHIPSRATVGAWRCATCRPREPEAYLQYAEDARPREVSQIQVHTAAQ